MRKDRKIVIIAGPNGAGKTTFAREFLPNEGGCPIFVNADLIAAGISPFLPEKAALHAGRLMIEEIKKHELQGESFAFETTLSGKTYAKMIPEWQQMGYRVKLVFLYLPDVAIAIERVNTVSNRAVIIYRRKLLGAGMKKAGRTFNLFIKTWLMHGFFLTTRTQLPD